jgi:hypothetical protein
MNTDSDTGIKAECDHLILYVAAADLLFYYYIVNSHANIVIWAGHEETIEDAKGAAVRAARRMLPSHACIAPIEWVNCEVPEIVRKFRDRLPTDDAPS